MTQNIQANLTTPSFSQRAEHWRPHRQATRPAQAAEAAVATAAYARLASGRLYSTHS